MITASRWQRYGSIQAVAGYVTWLAVTLAAWQTPPDRFAVGGATARPLMLFLLAATLLGFVVAATRERSQPRRAYLGLFLMTASSGATFLLGLLGTTPALLVMLTAVAVATVPLPAALAFVAVANGALLVAMLTRHAVAPALLQFAIFAGFQAFAAFASLAMRRATEAADALRETNAHLLATRSLLAEAARDGERLRLSRELHDVSGHKLTALKLNLALLAQEPAVAMRREFSIACMLTEELLHDLRGVVSQLRQHDGIDLSDALRRMASIVPKPRIHVDVATDARILDTERAASLLRIAQESLTNALRHAGAANVFLRLRAVADSLELSVADDGRAPTDLRTGHGIAGMRERVATLGGELQLAIGPAGGLCVTVRVPQARTA